MNKAPHTSPFARLSEEDARYAFLFLNRQPAMLAHLRDCGSVAFKMLVADGPEYLICVETPEHLDWETGYGLGFWIRENPAIIPDGWRCGNHAILESYLKGDKMDPVHEMKMNMDGVFRDSEGKISFSPELQQKVADGLRIEAAVQVMAAAYVARLLRESLGSSLSARLRGFPINRPEGFPPHGSARFEVTDLGSWLRSMSGKSASKPTTSGDEASSDNPGLTGDGASEDGLNTTFNGHEQ